MPLCFNRIGALGSPLLECYQINTERNFSMDRENSILYHGFPNQELTSKIATNLVWVEDGIVMVNPFILQIFQKNFKLKVKLSTFENLFEVQ